MKQRSSSFLKKRTKKLLHSLALAGALFLASCRGIPGPRFSQADQVEIARIGDYLNDTPKFQARFVQTGALGPGAGLVWLDRPGHLRIDYEGPAARVMVISDGRVRIVDRGTGSRTSMPLSKTPLGILLAPTISLSGPITVSALSRSPGGVQITLQKTDAPGQGSLTLYLSEPPLHLNAVTVTDAYQRSETLSLTDLNLNPALTPDLFRPPPLPGSS